MSVLFLAGAEMQLQQYVLNTTTTVTGESPVLEASR